jgi:hypothetical protein
LLRRRASKTRGGAHTLALLWYSLRACPVRLHLAPGLEPCGVRISVNAAAALCANIATGELDAEANATRYHLLAAEANACCGWVKGCSRQLQRGSKLMGVFMVPQ